MSHSSGIWFECLDQLSGGGPISDAACPACGPDCKTDVNKRRKVLRIWNDGDFITYKCARCEISGWAKSKSNDVTRPRQSHSVAVPQATSDKSDLAAYLWSKSLPLIGSPAETYLKTRGCFIASNNLRFLAPRDEHPGAMIARFGTMDVTGVHLTKLRQDGTGKAGTEKDKIMIGPSQGQPILIADNPDHGELIVAEGIEDAATLSVVTGWSAHAAGSAGRLASVIASASNFDRIYLAVDDDLAGRRALHASRAIRPDLVPLNLSKVLSFKEKTDANAVLAKFGAEALLASIEWCDARERYARGEIGFHAMIRAVSGSEAIFKALMEPLG